MLGKEAIPIVRWGCLYQGSNAELVWDDMRPGIDLPLAIGQGVRGSDVS